MVVHNWSCKLNQMTAETHAFLHTVAHARCSHCICTVLVRGTGPDGVSMVDGVFVLGDLAGVCRTGGSCRMA